MIPDVVSLGEMREEQRLDHFTRMTESRGVANQPMGVDR